MAGILDFLDSPGGGGILDFLRNNAMNQQFSSGLPSDQAQYGAAPQYNPAPSAFAQLQPNPAMMQPQQPRPVMQAQPMQAPQQYQPQPQQPAQPMQAPQMAAQPQSMPQPHRPNPWLGNDDSFLNRVMGNDPASIAAAQQQQVQNVTLRALLQKGVDPVTAQAAIGQPKLLEALVNQNFGPQTVQSLGGGYIYNPKTGKTERAYEPDDKIPFGWKKDDKGIHFEANGPADPAYLRLKAAQEQDPNAVHVLGKGGELYKVDSKGNPTVVHKNESNVDASLDDPTSTMMAQQYLAGDKTVLQNVGRGAQGSANLIKIRGAIKAEADKQGLDGNAIAQRMIDYVGDTARERTAATQEGRMSPAGIEAHGAITLGRQASDAVPRGNWVPINKAIQSMQEANSDPALRAFGAANTTIINTYARAINPNGVGTVADKEHAREMLSKADGPAAYKAVLDQLDREIEMAHRSPSQARAGFKQEREGRMNGTEPALPPAFGDAAPPTITRADAEAELRRRGKIK